MAGLGDVHIWPCRGEGMQELQLRSGAAAWEHADYRGRCPNCLSPSTQTQDSA